MIVKPQLIPLRLLADQALLNHLPPGTPERLTIEDELSRLQAGWRGEKELGFQLARFQEDELIRLFFDLHLGAMRHAFQMDCLLLTRASLRF